MEEQQTALLAEEQAAAEQVVAAEEAQRVATLAAQPQAQLARDAAAAEARRVAADAERVTAFEQLRNEEIATLAGLSERLQFQWREGGLDEPMERTLDRMFEPLYLYPEMPVVITVSSNEFRGSADNNRLSRERARLLVAYLVSRGLQEDRFDIQVESGERLPFESHRVRVSAEGPNQ